jgi:hypothetical protein
MYVEGLFDLETLSFISKTALQKSLAFDKSVVCKQLPLGTNSSASGNAVHLTLLLTLHSHFRLTL